MNLLSKSRGQVTWLEATKALVGMGKFAQERHQAIIPGLLCCLTDMVYVAASISLAPIHYDVDPKACEKRVQSKSFVNEMAGAM